MALSPAPGSWCSGSTGPGATARPPGLSERIVRGVPRSAPSDRQPRAARAAAHARDARPGRGPGSGGSTRPLPVRYGLGPAHLRPGRCRGHGDGRRSRAGGTRPARAARAAVRACCGVRWPATATSPLTGAGDRSRAGATSCPPYAPGWRRKATCRLGTRPWRMPCAASRRATASRRTASWSGHPRRLERSGASACARSS